MVSLPAALLALTLSSVGQTEMLDFYSDSCGPCRAMNRTVRALEEKGYPVRRVNTVAEPQLAAKYRVQTIPCFVMLVNGKEVDRVVGGTTLHRLEQMCMLAGNGTSGQSTPAAMAQQTAPTGSIIPAQAALAAPFDGWQSQPAARQAIPPAENASPGVADAELLAASVRLRVEDSTGHSCGSGTIVDARDGKALILTCGHIFRDSQGKGRIDVDLFGPGGQRQAVGQLYSFDLTRDVGLVVIDSPGPLAVARVAPPGYAIQPGMPVVSVGCNNGADPTARHSRVTSLNKFMGPPNLQVAGQPVEGRSGGGLFSREGYLIGVCNAADPSDQEGLFAALGSIYAELDRKDAGGNDLSFVYKSPGEKSVGVVPAAESATLASFNQPAAPDAAAGPAELAPINALAAVAPPAQLPPHERAALQEIRRREKEGAEVVIIIRPRNNPQARSEVLTLDHASREFVEQISTEARRQDKPFPTSFEQPKPRKIMLEWSAESDKPK